LQSPEPSSLDGLHASLVRLVRDLERIHAEELVPSHRRVLRDLLTQAQRLEERTYASSRALTATRAAYERQQLEQNATTDS
jgi:hypothetical protein